MIPVLSTPPFDLACLAEDRAACVGPAPFDEGVPGEPVPLPERPAWGAAAWTGPDDLRASAHLAIHGRFLYGRVRVVDDVKVPAGLAGDHVEVWLAEPRALAETRGWMEGLEADIVRHRTNDEPVHAELEAAEARARRLLPVVQLIVAPPAEGTRGEVRTLAGAAVGEAVWAYPGGGSVAFRVPLEVLPRIGTLTPSALALRVDVIDADTPARPRQESLVSTDPAWRPRNGSTLTIYWLTRDADLTESPDAPPPAPAPYWERRDGAWVPVAPDGGFSLIDLSPYAVLDGYLPAREVVTRLDGPSPLRVIDRGAYAVVQRWGPDGWTDLVPGAGVVDPRRLREEEGSDATAGVEVLPAAGGAWLVTWLDPEPTFRARNGSCGGCHTVQLVAWWRDAHGVHQRMSANFYEGGETYRAWREGNTLRWARDTCEGTVRLLDEGRIAPGPACLGWMDRR